MHSDLNEEFIEFLIYYLKKSNNANQSLEDLKYVDVNLIKKRN